MHVRLLWSETHIIAVYLSNLLVTQKLHAVPGVTRGFAQLHSDGIIPIAI